MWYISYDGSFFTLRTCEPVSEKLLWQLEETFPAGRLVLDKTMVYDKINHVVNKIHQTLIRNSKNFLFFRELPDAARQ